MKEFLIDYGYYLALGVIILVESIIIPLINGKCSQKEKSISLLSIIEKLPTYINEAEAMLGSKTGVAKLEIVKNKVRLICLENKISYDDCLISKAIEDILSTPTTKKEDSKC